MHPEIYIGRERFRKKFADGTLDASFFERENFIDPTFTLKRNALPKVSAMSEEQINTRREVQAAKFDQAKYIGDKYPSIARTFPWLWDRFPGAKVVYIVRNPISVAESYEQRNSNPDDSFKRDARDALNSWNASVADVVSALDAGRDIVVVSYELLFRKRRHMKQLFSALGLTTDGLSQKRMQGFADYAQGVSSKPAPKDDMLRRTIFLEANLDAYRQLVNNHCILAAATKADSQTSTSEALVDASMESDLG